MSYPKIVLLDRASVILRISLALSTRSGRPWHVRGGPVGQDYGRLVISAPPARRTDTGQLSEDDRTDLAQLLGLDTVDPAGVVIDDSYDHFREYIDRAEGRAPRVLGVTYDWETA